MIDHDVEISRRRNAEGSPASPAAGGARASAARRSDTAIVTELGMLGTVQTGRVSAGRVSAGGQRPAQAQPSSTLGQVPGSAVSSVDEVKVPGLEARARAARQHVWLPWRGGEEERVQELVATIVGSRFLDGTRYYEIAVRFHTMGWAVERRYRQFRELHLALAGMLPSRFWVPSPHTSAASGSGCKVRGLPPFPPRALRLKYEAAGNHEGAEARLQALQLYLDGISQLQGLALNRAVQLFFDLSAGRQQSVVNAAAARALSLARASVDIGMLRDWPGAGDNTPCLPSAHRGAPPARGWSLSSFDSVRAGSGPGGRSGRASSCEQMSDARDGRESGSDSEWSCVSDSEVGGRAEPDDRDGPRSARTTSASPPAGACAPRGGRDEDPPHIVPTDASMWENYGYWVHEVAPQWEATMKQSQRKKQAQALVCSEGVSAFARGILWPLSIGNVLQLNRDLYGILKDKARSARALASSSSLLLSFGFESSAELIETDLSRTMSHLSLFDAAGPYGEELRDVLEAYCFYRPDVGYVQGMSYQVCVCMCVCVCVCVCV